MEFEDPKRAKYNDIKQTLQKRFGSSDLVQIHEKALSDVKLVKGQSYYDVAHEIRRLTKRAYPDLSPQGRERFAVKSFTRALDDPNAVIYVRENDPKILQDACDLYVRFDALQTDTDCQRRRTNIKVVSN